MFAIIGGIVVLLSVIGGFLLEKGNLHVLFQPAEFVIIGGAALGSFIIASPPRVLSMVIKNIFKIFSAKNFSKTFYLELLCLLYQLFSKARKEGLVAIEADVENPQRSPLFQKYKNVMAHPEFVTFIADNFKVIVSSNVPSHELDSLMELEIETGHKEAAIPSTSIGRVADGLPGLGIVAAVLGVVLTMQKIDQPPAVLGHSIGAALVGTFLGVLMCYGFVGPVSVNLEHLAREKAIPFHVIRIAMVSFVGGSAPQIAVEFGRRTIPEKEKPTFKELENSINKLK
ncbi:MAG: flagellar motor stator protein MotA [Thermodesulfovibrionales bacterium]